MKKLITLALLALTLPACGSGGGGGDSFIGAATVNVRTSPNRIDTGDRTLVNIDVSDMHEDGILLKVRFPSALAYVPGTAFLEINGNETDISPDKNVADSNRRFLVFFLDRSDIDENQTGKVIFQLVGNNTVSEGNIEVDADVNDSLIADEDEFSASSPEFGEESSASIEVTN